MIFLEVFEISCDPGSKPTVKQASFALHYWQQFTEIPRLQCPWHTHPCRTQLRGNRWRVLWCCRIKALNPVPAISVARVEFIVCDTKLTTNTYLVPCISQISLNSKHISPMKCLNLNPDPFPQEKLRMQKSRVTICAVGKIIIRKRTKERFKTI